MGLNVRGISSSGWSRIARWTLFGTLGCIAIATAFNYVFFGVLAPEALVVSLYSATIIPIILAAPLFIYLSIKLRELAIANHSLRKLASTDSLTECLNRGAFTTLVEQATAAADAEGQGALLVIDADHFKSINDRFGHHEGDLALRSIADAIRAAIRRDDICGRLGGEEFGVYLPGATPAEALAVAERIRRKVQQAQFIPNGRRCMLSVSVGGAVHDQALPFGELFRLADEKLYSAKASGRDRVEMAYAGATSAATEMALTIH